ncbi:MAG: YhfC family intramembrane metalloprotease [Myxococcales bacterium]|nr:YhfC family intramembrane metalloprotease [Myxococcales bacterium]
MKAAMLFSAVALMVLPIFVTARVRARLKFSRSLVALGAASFVLSQVVHVPLLVKLQPGLLRPFWLAAAVLGLLAGLCEELTRYLALRALKKTDVADGVGFGLGHGGVEAFLLGLVIFLALVFRLPVASPTLSSVALQAQLPGWVPQAVLPVAERAMVLTLHVAFTLLVQQSVRARRLRWLALAVLAHGLVDAAVLYLFVNVGPLSAEAALGLATLTAVPIIQHFLAHRDPPQG